jgi:hypothetical protein
VKATAVYKKCDDSQRANYNEFLRQVMLPRYGGHTQLSGIGEFDDKGLFYMPRDGILFECISGLARMALTPLLTEALKHTLPPIDSEKVYFPSHVFHRMSQ